VRWDSCSLLEERIGVVKITGQGTREALKACGSRDHGSRRRELLLGS
jgi:hypothetical protein